MPTIRANRESIDDRFSVLGFTVRTESPLFEEGLATDPKLFRPGAQRTRRNFYSSRVHGAMRARRGEAVYLVPPEVLVNFLGQQRLYFGLVTYREGATSQPETVLAPSTGNMYINLSGLTERGLRRATALGLQPPTTARARARMPACSGVEMQRRPRMRPRPQLPTVVGPMAPMATVRMVPPRVLHPTMMVSAIFLPSVHRLGSAPVQSPTPATTSSTRYTCNGTRLARRRTSFQRRGRRRHGHRGRHS
jgi:hypothetical protein